MVLSSMPCASGGMSAIASALKSLCAPLSRSSPRQVFIALIFRGYFGAEIEREKLGELLDAKWAGSRTGEAYVPVPSFILANAFQREVVCHVERLR